MKSSKIPPITAQSVTEVRNFTFSLQRFLLNPDGVGSLIGELEVRAVALGCEALGLMLWQALPLRSPTRRWRALPLAKIEPFHSTPIRRLLISVSAFNFRVEEDWARKGVRSHQSVTTTQADRTILRSA